MENLARAMLVSGMAAVVMSQIYIVYRAVRNSWLHGLLCLVIPAYILYYAWRREERKTALLWWLGGVATLIFSPIVGVLA